MSSETSDRAQQVARLRVRFPEADPEVIEDALAHSNYDLSAAADVLIGFGCNQVHDPPPPPVAPPHDHHALLSSVFNDFNPAHVQRALAQAKGDENMAIEVHSQTRC